MTTLPRVGRIGAGPSIQVRGRASLSLESVPAVTMQVAATQTQALNPTIGAFGVQQYAWRDRLLLFEGMVFNRLSLDST